MNNKKSKKASAMTCIVIALALACAFGLSINVMDSAVSGYEKSLNTRYMSVIEHAPDICSSQIFQLLIIFISGFTMISHPICLGIILYRTTALIYSIRVYNIYSLSDMIYPIISYTVVTVFAVYLSYRSMTMKRTYDNIKNASSEILTSFASFLIVSGASAFMKVVPMILFG